MVNRRKFIINGSMLAMCSSVPLINLIKENREIIVHHVLFWLKNRGSKKDRDKLIAGIKGLEKIKFVKLLHVGIPANTPKRDVVDASYDVSELIFFDNIEAQNNYQIDPIHEKFIADYSHLWETVVVYDSLSI